VELAELTEMKVQLEKLESKMNAADAFAKSKEAGKVKRQIDELWEKIDSLSNKLNPDFLKGYMS
jgi:predicted  nucleic acid-binding Zn-ribbon protein